MQKVLFFLSFAFLSLNGLSQEDYRIYLQNATLDDSHLKTPYEVTPSELQAHRYQDRYYLILQFDHIPSSQEKERLQARGVALLEYLPNFAFLGRVPAGTDLGSLGLRRVGLLQPAYKLSRELGMGNYPAHALVGSEQIDLVALPYKDIPQPVLKEFLAQQGFSLLPDPPGSYGVAVRTKIKSIGSLASASPIMYLQTIEAPSVPDDLRGRSVHRANTLSQGPGIGYDGTGITMGIADDGGINHIDFTGRLNDLTSSQGGTHGDGVSGISVGAGNLDPTMTGMATGAFLNLYGIGGYPHIINAISNFYNLETVVTSTSYSQGCGGVYDATARDLDRGVDSIGALLHVFSAGNSASSSCSSVYGSVSEPGGYYYGNITGGRKAAKSSIATANLFYDDGRAASSSRGPCEDGRLKPDISAHGQGQMTTAPDNGYMSFGGTSAAAPGVAGVSAMLYQAYRDTNNGAYPSSSLIKGILLNTADDLGRAGPDYDFGWGRINARRALEVILNQQYLNGSLSQNNTRHYVIAVPSGVSQLKVMVYWKDPAGSLTAAKALVNDLDMTLSLPGGGNIRPWILSKYPHLDSLQRPAFRGIDRVNNMEQVTINNPAAGNYTVNISGYAVPMGPQSFHVVYSFVTNGITVTYPQGDERFVPGETETLRWDAFGNTGTFSIAYSTNNGTSWTGVVNNLPGDQRYYDWTVPNTVTGNARIRITRGNDTGISAAPFNILGLPGNIRFQGNGLFSTNVIWNPVNGANQYDVYLLGAKYMDSIGTTSSTSFLLNNLVLGNEYWVAVRARNASGIKGRRSKAILLQHQPTSACGGCVAQICSFPYEESFEQGVGEWCQGTNDDIDWTRNTGGTPSSNTGPSGAAHGSYYLYVESTLPNHPNKVAILNSPCFNLAGVTSPTLTFSYHMFGAAMGSLELLVSTDKGLSWSSPIWSRQGNQGATWQTQSINLNAYAGGSIAFRFRATTGSDFTSDIALDRILVNGTQSTSPLALNVSSQNITCFGLQTGAATALGSGGSSPYTYYWSTGDSSASISGLGAGTYQVAVLDTFTCVAWDSFAIQSPSPILTTLSATPANCYGDRNGSATLSALGGWPPYQATWSNGASGLTLTGVPAGTYYVTLTDALGCTKQDSVVISQPLPLDLNASHTDISCFGLQDGTASISPSGGNGNYSIIWSTGSSAPSLGGLAAGTYQVLVSDAKGCFTSGALTILQPPQLQVGLQSQDVTCYGDSDGQALVAPSGGVGGYSFLWTGGVTDSVLTGIPAGVYSITVSDSNGCQAIDSVSVAQPDPIVLTTSFSDPRCFDSADGSAIVAAAGGNGGMTYLWSTGATDSMLTQLAAGSYTVTATDIKGCALRDTLTLTAPPQLLLSLSVTDASAPGVHDGAIDLSISGGTPPYQSIQWSTGDTTEDLSGLAPGQYHVTLTDANGCIIRDTTVVGSLTGIAGKLVFEKLELFPNPTRETLFLTYRLKQPAPCKVKVLDLTGRLILERGLPAMPGAHTLALEVRELAAGTYVLEVSSSQGSTRLKWIKTP